MKCDVCGTEENFAGVASSSLGPISFAFCVECAQRYAEPSFMLACNLDMMEGKIQNLADWAKDISTFVDGKYVTFQEFFDKHYTYTDIFAEMDKEDASTSSCG
jgi:hypothetical protein